MTKEIYENSLFLMNRPITSRSRKQGFAKMQLGM